MSSVTLPELRSQRASTKTKQALSRIPNITEISMEGDDDDIGVGDGNPVDLPNIRHDFSFFPGLRTIINRF
jgi:hypothetical protein